MSHNEPTTPDYYSSNDTTLVDACYPYNGRTEIPPPPPGTHRIGIRVIILMSVVCIILAGVIGMYTIGSNKETQKSNNNFTTSISTPTIPHTTNP